MLYDRHLNNNKQILKFRQTNIKKSKQVGNRFEIDYIEVSIIQTTNLGLSIGFFVTDKSLAINLICSTRLITKIITT